MRGSVGCLIDRHRRDRGDPIVPAEYSAGAVLSAHSISTCPTTAVTTARGNLSGDAATDRKDAEARIGNVSVVVSVRCLWSVGDHGGGIDLLRHRSWHRVWRREVSEVADVSVQ
jgi:hypothetical protein